MSALKQKIPYDPRQNIIMKEIVQQTVDNGYQYIHILKKQHVKKERRLNYFTHLLMFKDTQQKYHVNKLLQVNINTSGQVCRNFVSNT